MGCFRDSIQACLFVEMAVVHSGVHQTGSLGRETRFFDGIKRSMPSWIRDVSYWQDLSGSSDMEQDQSVFCRKERKRHQSALLYLQTVQEGWGSMRGWTDLKSANTTQWSDFPTGEGLCGNSVWKVGYDKVQRVGTPRWLVHMLGQAVGSADLL